MHGDIDKPRRPMMVPLADEALPLIEEFGSTMQDRQASAGGLLRSARQSPWLGVASISESGNAVVVRRFVGAGGLC
jgi:hypothetical protein